MKALHAAKQCNSGQYFHYADSSTSLPQGPLYYFFECLFGSLGITEYLNILTLEIIISQLLIFSSFFIFRNFVNENVLYSSISLYSLNPYLIVSTRNTTSHYHQEIILVFFFLLLLKRNDNKNTSILLGFICAITLSAYYLLFIFTICMLITFVMTKKINYLQQIFIGGIIGMIINVIFYIPYFQANGLNFIVFQNSSWGLSSYWRILTSFLSGKSIVNKINNPSDYDEFVFQYNNFELLINLNTFIILSLYTIALIHIYKKKTYDDINLIGINIFITYGVVMTLLDVALYPHYLFSIFIFGYIFLFRNLEKTKFLIIPVIIFCFSSFFIFTTFNNYIAKNNGAVNSDFGQTYQTCGCCVDDARVCRGQ